MKKKFLSVILVLSMLCAFMPVIATAATSGTCGANVTWTLDDNGTLTISGTGDMKDYGGYSSPFYNNSNIKSVIIEDGVMSVGNFTFQNCSGLTSITIPNSITSIGTSAFIGCGVLESIYISDIAAYLNIDFKSDASNPMSRANKLYLNNKRITGVLTIPEGVTKIPNYAFKSCDSLTGVTIPDSVINIGNYAFYDCSNLTTVTIGNCVSRIGDFAFENCSRLTSVIIGNNVTSIGNSAFDKCYNLDSVYITDLAAYLNIDFYIWLSNPMYYAKKLYLNNKIIAGEVIIPDGVTQISMFAFSRCDGITSITIPDSVTNIENYAFNNCSGITKINYNIQKAFSNVFPQCNNLILAVLGDNVTSIDKNAFSGCSNLKRILIPKSVTEIESSAFENCTKLTSVEYGGSQLDWEQMYIGLNNENLTNAKINYNSSNIDMTLTDLDYLSYTKNDGNTITITDCNTAATSIIIPDKIDGIPVTEIVGSYYNGGSYNSGAFSNCNKLTTITIPNSIKNIGSSTFHNCDNLEDVYFTGTETEWNAIDVEYGNSALTNANIHYNKTAPTPTPTPTPKPTPIPTTTATITMTKTDTTYNFDVLPEATYANCYVYAAVYDESGALLAVNRVPLEMTGNTNISVDKSANDVLAKVFIWSDTLQPIITAEEFPLI